jgi:hypothetical protein
VKWVQDKAFQKGRGILLKLVTICQEFPSLVIFFLDLITVTGLSFSQKKKEELDKRLFFKNS